MIDVKKFYTLSCNDGKYYIRDNCGCLKGNFYRSLIEGLPEETHLKKLDFDINGTVGVLMNKSNPDYCVYNEPVNFHTTRPLLAKILDRGELLFRSDIPEGKGRPEYAKRFVVRAMRRYGLLEKDTSDIKETNYAKV